MTRKELGSGSERCSASASSGRAAGAALARRGYRNLLSTSRKKTSSPLARSVAREVIRTYASWVESAITPATVIRASEIGETWQISFWDGMILAAAEQDRVTELLSEDISHGRRVAGVKVRNPFLET